MSTCVTCGCGDFTLDRQTGVMKCSNGHVNLIGMPSHYKPEGIAVDKNGEVTQSEYLDNNLMKKPPR
jgi:hypothetical protein